MEIKNFHHLSLYHRNYLQKLSDFYFLAPDICLPRAKKMEIRIPTVKTENLKDKGQRI